MRGPRRSVFPVAILGSEKEGGVFFDSPRLLSVPVFEVLRVLIFCVAGATRVCGDDEGCGESKTRLPVRVLS